MVTSAATHNLTIVRGDDYRFRFRPKDSNGDGLDLSGSVFTFAIKLAGVVLLELSSPSNGVLVIDDADTDGGTVESGPVDPYVRVTLTETQTAALPADKTCTYALKRFLGSGSSEQEETWVRGYIRVEDWGNVDA